MSWFGARQSVATTIQHWKFDIFPSRRTGPFVIKKYLDKSLYHLLKCTSNSVSFQRNLLLLKSNRWRNHKRSSAKPSQAKPNRLVRSSASVYNMSRWHSQWSEIKQHQIVNCDIWMVMKFLAKYFCISNCAYTKCQRVNDQMKRNRIEYQKVVNGTLATCICYDFLKRLQTGVYFFSLKPSSAEKAKPLCSVVDFIFFSFGLEMSSILSAVRNRNNDVGFRVNFVSTRMSSAVFYGHLRMADTEARAYGMIFRFEIFNFEKVGVCFGFVYSNE